MEDEDGNYVPLIPQTSLTGFRTLNGGESSEYAQAEILAGWEEISLARYGTAGASELPAFTEHEIDAALEPLGE